MSLCLSRRTFSQLSLALIAGCDEASRPKDPVQTASPAAPAISAVASSMPTLREPELPIFRDYPQLANRIFHLPLGDFPTPIDRAAILGVEIGVPNLWIKRDDLSGRLFGGGKIRKLEFYLAEPRARQASEIVTFGAYGSNQALATALWGKKLGLSVRTILAPQMPNEYVKKNLFALRKTGAGIEVAMDGLGAAEQRLTEKILQENDKSMYLIPPGGSSPLGNVAFINAAYELVHQIKTGVIPRPDCIYMAMGTMGSIAGLAIGLDLLGVDCEIVAVRASSAETSSELRFWALVEETMRYLRARDPSFPKIELQRRRVRFQTQQLGTGYGFTTRSGTRAMGVFAKATGYSLEPTYTAKAFAALIAENKRLAKKNVLFWNSHNTQPLDASGVTIADFPQHLQNYLRMIP